jgi:hypothetical protein
VTLADMLLKLEKGKIGHGEAMRWLGVDNYTDLVRIVHLNGRRMPGHRSMKIAPRTKALLRQLIRKPHRIRKSTLPLV